ncbi:hypothetical protein BHM03_00030114 [Ensete ventricosum]|nr:hypothetical protein BHM03_00030114 [Ensete ventricosum]
MDSLMVTPPQFPPSFSPPRTSLTIRTLSSSSVLDPSPPMAALPSLRRRRAQARAPARKMRAIGPGPPWFLPFRRRPGIPPPPASVLNNLRHRPWRPRRILDPGGDAVLRWNRIFLVSCLVALFVDPLYFYLLYIGGPACVRIDVNIGIIVTFFRTVADLFYLGHMLLKFWIAFVAPAPGSSAGASLSRTRIRLLCGT